MLIGNNIFFQNSKQELTLFTVSIPTDSLHYEFSIIKPTNTIIDFKINWDYTNKSSKFEQFTSTKADNSYVVSHDYETNGIYQIAITNEIVDFSPTSLKQDSPYAKCILSIDRVGKNTMKTKNSLLGYQYTYCSNLQMTDVFEDSLKNVKTFAGIWHFIGCKSITSLKFPALENTGSSSFNSMSELTTIDLSGVRSIAGSTFRGCSKLTELNLPNCETIGGPNTFFSAGIKKLIVPNVLTFNNPFASSKIQIIDMSERKEELLNTIPTLTSGTTLPSTITDIYVPANIEEIFKTNEQWSVYADKIKIKK